MRVLFERIGIDNKIMYRDFIGRQTSDFDSQFKAKTLVGNWYEERCNPSNPANFHFYVERKQPEQVGKPILTRENFQASSSNWLAFQQPHALCTEYG